MNKNFLPVFLRLLAGVLGFFAFYILSGLLILWLGIWGVLILAIALAAVGALLVVKLDAYVTVEKEDAQV